MVKKYKKTKNFYEENDGLIYIKSKGRLMVINNDTFKAYKKLLSSKQIKEEDFYYDNFFPKLDKHDKIKKGSQEEKKQ